MSRHGRAQCREPVAVGELHARRALHERLDDHRRQLGARGPRPCRSRCRSSAGPRTTAPATPGSAARRRGRCRSRRRRRTARRWCRRGTRRRTRGSACDRGRPGSTQNWNAILSACSTADAPSDAKRKCGVVHRHDARQRLGQLDHDAVAVPEHGRVRAAVELVAQGVVELGDLVTERVHPQRRDRVEVATAVDVDDLVPLRPLDDDRRVVGVRRHLREPVPHVRGVAGDPVATHSYSDTESAPRSRNAARIFPAASSSDPSGGLGSARANDSSPAASNGTTWMCTCGTSSPTISTPMRRASSAAVLRLADGLRHPEQVRGQLGVEVDPVVDLGAGNHERVAGVHRVDREERHALGVFPHEHGGQLTLDDAREDRRHRPVRG